MINDKTRPIPFVNHAYPPQGRTPSARHFYTGAVIYSPRLKPEATILFMPYGINWLNYMISGYRDT